MIKKQSQVIFSEDVVNVSAYFILFFFLGCSGVHLGEAQMILNSCSLRDAVGLRWQASQSTFEKMCFSEEPECPSQTVKRSMSTASSVKTIKSTESRGH